MINSLKKFGIGDWAYTENLYAKSHDKLVAWNKKYNQNNVISYLLGEKEQKRESLTRYWSDALSALVFVFPYKLFLSQGQKIPIASFILNFDSQDYHLYIKNKLTKVACLFLEDYGEFNYKIIVDTSAVLERDLAYRSGLGFFGKNNLLINQEFGSAFIIGTILLDKKLSIPIKEIQENNCKECTLCIKKCPVSALNELELDPSRCLSSKTMESKTLNAKNLHGAIFGCDLCQLVCPFNKNQLCDVDILTGRALELYQFFCRESERVFSDLTLMSSREYKIFVKDSSFARVKQNFLIECYKQSILDKSQGHL